MEYAPDLRRLYVYASFVKLEHAVFSLPAIFAGALLGMREWPPLRLTLLMLTAAAGARTVAMGLNRLVDVAIDARNPRTRNRELPRAAMQPREAWWIVVIACGGYVAAAAAIAPICLRLSAIPVVLFFVYPYLKRVTAFAHLGLGVAWSMGPVAGWIAAAQSLSGVTEVAWLWLFSVLWVTGFDIIYATMDEAFDREAGLHSLPARLGKQPALRMAALLHAAAFGALCLLWYKQLYTDISLVWLAAIGALFLWQHLVAARRPEFAFFKLNGAIGFLVLGFIAMGV